MAQNDRTLGSFASAKPIYKHETELRHLPDNLIYKLAVILDENDNWCRLMRIIPKHLDARLSRNKFDYEKIVASGLKYNDKDIQLILNAYERMPADSSISQIMIDEWKISGRINERPTLGLLLQLLVHAQLFRAADYVATELLNERKPERPLEGPAAPIFLESDEIRAMDGDINDVFMPSTGTLNANACCDHTIAINKDYYEKVNLPYNKFVGNDSMPAPNNVPKPMPRIKRQTQQRTDPSEGTSQSQNNRQTTTTSDSNNSNNSIKDIVSQEGASVPNVPILSILQKISSNAQTNTSKISSIPLAIATTTNEDFSTDTSNMDTDDAVSSSGHEAAPIPQVTLLLDNVTNNQTSLTSSNDSNGIALDDYSAGNDSLPVLSELNLLGERDNCEISSVHANGSTQKESDERSNSLSNDIDDDDDNSLPNLSILEQRSSNNDSSLTTVTGTSGENSFELTNDSSSTSNEDNIPCLSELQP